MNISSVAHPQYHVHASGQRSNRSNHIGNVPIESSRSAATKAEVGMSDIKEPEAMSRSHDGPKGVFGLLQSGHFNGVAAVRLSINFHEQLSGLNLEAVRPQVGEMDGLQPDTDEVNTIPEFTAPNGNGVAFEKFMSIYRGLDGIETFGDTGATPAAGAGAGSEEGVNLQA